MPRSTKRREAAEKAFRIVKYGALAAFQPPDITLDHFSRIRGPFRTSAERNYARALCTVIASEARVDTRHITLEMLYCVCSIAVARYKSIRARPPSYFVAQCQQC